MFAFPFFSRKKKGAKKQRINQNEMINKKTRKYLVNKRIMAFDFMKKNVVRCSHQITKQKNKDFI